MDFATLIGIVVAFALVLISISLGSGLDLFIDYPSMLIVFGGTFGATMVHHPLKEVFAVFKVMRHVFFTRLSNSNDIIPMFVGLAHKSRKEGILALESELETMDDPFLLKGLQLAIDGMEPESIRQILETEVECLEERHRSGGEILNTMGTLFPSMGMIGTLIGLVQMLKSMADPSTIGPAMAVALLTTFYGAVGANLVCLPMAGKLRKRSKEEVAVKDMLICGILSLAAGDNPRILEQKLLVFVPPALRQSIYR